jgi:hypothetical protein
VILSAISATLLAIRDAIIAYAPDTPLPPLGESPATEYAFLAGAAFGGAGLATPLGACLAPPTLGRLTGARGAVGFFGMTPLTDGR